MSILEQIQAQVAAEKARESTYVPVPELVEEKPVIRELGFTTPGENFPMNFPTDQAGQDWERARHAIGTELGILHERDGSGWLVILSPGRDPIFLLGPLKTVQAPF